MARAPETMTEMDGDDHQPLSMQDIPDGLSGSSVEIPQPRQPAGAPEDYQIVETDDAGQPLGRDTSLAEQDNGDKPLVQQAQPEPAQRKPHRRSPQEEREARKRGRERTFAEVAALHQEVATLRTQLQAVEPRLTQFDLARVQSQISDIDRQIDTQAQRAAAAAHRLSQAMVSQDADAFSAAMSDRDQALVLGQRLEASKNLLSANMQRFEQAAVAPQPQPQPQPGMRPSRIPPAVQAYVEDFTDNHDWYDPRDPRDIDSQTVLRLDQAVAADGFDPAGQDYWDELNDRMRQHLPHRFEPVQRPARQQAQAAPQRRGPAVAAPSERSPAPRQPNQLYLTPGRKQALIEVGALDRDGRTVANREKFAKLAKQYQDYDRVNGYSDAR